MENYLLYVILIMGSAILNWDIINKTKDETIPEEE